MATIQREQWNDSSRCLLSLRRALEYSPSHEGAVRELEVLLDDSEFFEEVSEILETVYRTLNDTTKLAALFERRIGLACFQRGTARGSAHAGSSARGRGRRRDSRAEDPAAGRRGGAQQPVHYWRSWLVWRA